jgi:hypothetical protein
MVNIANFLLVLDGTSILRNY